MPGGYPPTAEQQAERDTITNKYMDRAFNFYPVEEMIGDMIAIYQRHVSRTDVEALITFYSSQAGQDLLNVQPVIMKEYLPLVMKRPQERTKALTDEMAKDMTDSMKPATPPAATPQPK